MSVEGNIAFLTNIFEKGPFQGHAFICHPARTPIYETALGDYTLSDRPVAEWVPEIAAHYAEQARYGEALGDHSVPTAGLVCATHLYAAAFGCEVHPYEDNNPCALPLVRTADEADRLDEPDIWKSPTLYRVFELADAVGRELGPDAHLGPCDLQSGFDTASLVWNKEDLLCAMLLDPEPVKRLVDKCASLFKRFLTELRRAFPRLVPAHYPRPWVPPTMGPWLSNDECGAFGAESFEMFCLPELVDLAETFGGLGMHCCADAEHQFESFKKIPNFYAFNRVPGRQGWDPLLEHFDGPDSPVHVVAAPAVDRIAALVRAAAPQTRFVFVYNSQSLDDARQWLDQVRAIA